MLKNLSRGKPDGALPRTEVYIAVVDDFKNVTFDRPDFLLKELSGLSEEAAGRKACRLRSFSARAEIKLRRRQLVGTEQIRGRQAFFQRIRRVGFAFSRTCCGGGFVSDVGVDIEEVTPDRFNAGLAEKFTARESLLLAARMSLFYCGQKKKRFLSERAAAVFFPGKSIRSAWILKRCRRGITEKAFT